jgi:tetratricopeptide (TPR) repeat protein
VLSAEYGFAWANLAASLDAAEDHGVDASLAAYEQAIALMPHRARTHFNLGRSLMGLHAWSEAATWLQRAVQLSPRFPAALFQLALCLQETGRIKQALEVSE